MSTLHKNTLRKKLDSMLFERTAISKKPEELAKEELTALPHANSSSKNPTQPLKSQKLD